MANNVQLATDTFVSGSLAAGWAVIPTNSFSQITGTPFVAEPPSTAASGSRQMWTGLAFPKDQTSEITINAITSEAGTQAELWVRVQSVQSGLWGIHCVRQRSIRDSCRWRCFFDDHRRFSHRRLPELQTSSSLHGRDLHVWKSRFRRYFNGQRHARQGWILARL